MAREAPDRERILTLWADGKTAGQIRELVKRTTGQRWTQDTVNRVIWTARQAGDQRAARRNHRSKPPCQTTA